MQSVDDGARILIERGKAWLAADDLWIPLLVRRMIDRCDTLGAQRLITLAQKARSRAWLALELAPADSGRHADIRRKLARPWLARLQERTHRAHARRVG